MTPVIEIIHYTHTHQTHSTITRAVLKIEKALQACKGLMASRERVGAQLFTVGIRANVRLSISTCQTWLQSRLDLTWMEEQ